MRFRARVHTHTHTHTPLGYLGKQQIPNNSLPANSYPANSHPTSSFQIAPRTPRLSEVVHCLQLAAGLRSELSCSHLVLEKKEMNIDNKGSASALGKKVLLNNNNKFSPALVQSAELAALGC